MEEIDCVNAQKWEYDWKNVWADDIFTIIGVENVCGGGVGKEKSIYEMGVRDFAGDVG